MQKNYSADPFSDDPNWLPTKEEADEIKGNTNIPREFLGIWIPREIWLSKELSVMEKSLLAEIHSLEGEQGCYASNKYLGEFFSLTESGLRKILYKLIKKGYIKKAGYGKHQFGARRLLKTCLPTTKTEPSPCVPNVVEGCPKRDMHVSQTGHPYIKHNKEYNKEESIKNTPASAKNALECTPTLVKEPSYTQAVSKLETKQEVLTNERCVFEYYKRVRGIEESDVLSDYIDFPRFIRSIKKLLGYTKNSKLECFKAIEWVNNWANRNNMTDEQWNLSTVAKKFYDFKTSKDNTILTNLTSEEKYTAREMVVGV